MSFNPLTSKRKLKKPSQQEIECVYASENYILKKYKIDIGQDTQQLPLAECLKCKEKVWKICSDSRCKEKTAIFCDFCGKDQNNYNHENHENISYLKLYYWLENYYMDMMNEQTQQKEGLKNDIESLIKQTQNQLITLKQYKKSLADYEKSYFKQKHYISTQFQAFQQIQNPSLSHLQDFMDQLTKKDSKILKFTQFGDVFINQFSECNLIKQQVENLQKFDKKWDQAVKNLQLIQKSIYDLDDQISKENFNLFQKNKSDYQYFGESTNSETNVVGKEQISDLAIKCPNMLFIKSQNLSFITSNTMKKVMQVMEDFQEKFLCFIVKLGEKDNLKRILSNEYVNKNIQSIQIDLTVQQISNDMELEDKENIQPMANILDKYRLDYDKKLGNQIIYDVDTETCIGLVSIIIQKMKNLRRLNLKIEKISFSDLVAVLDSITKSNIHTIEIQIQNLTYQNEKDIYIFNSQQLQLGKKINLKVHKSETNCRSFAQLLKYLYLNFSDIDLEFYEILSKDQTTSPIILNQTMNSTSLIIDLQDQRLSQMYSSTDYEYLLQIPFENLFLMNFDIKFPSRCKKSIVTNWKKKQEGFQRLFDQRKRVLKLSRILRYYVGMKFRPEILYEIEEFL